ncbi:MarR family transcriptional regulator [Exiguobacterium sp. MER 193]|uniref:MarR family winged helix-turn-helix transcriptional regulator n=1 Tax=Exiguobacterium sp. MER 193 TaxID=2939564 RepID=UPI00203D363E|nr:MarR family transcriptional regulator [Exiguobacterium sp. MER 193]MCM3281709.1 MarR family transcriptional regulator [Exiguobacterium sp. MER 193]
MDTAQVALQLNKKFDQLQLLLLEDYRHFVRFDLTPQSEAILNYVMSQSNTTPSEIGTAFRISRSAVTQVLNRLEADGFIQRRRADSDKRVTLVSLGKQGLEYQVALAELTTHLSKTYYSQIDKRELNRLVTSLDQLIDVVTRVKEDNDGTR